MITTDADVDALLAAAEVAAPVLRESTPTDRAALLRALADRLDAETDRLVPVAAAESGLPLPRLTGEVARTSGQLRLFAEVLDDGALLEAVLDSADDTLAPPRPDLRRWLEPVGPVLVFAASNFPFAFSVLGNDTASALAAGCPVIAKAHPAHVRLSVRLAEIAIEALTGAGAPEGAFSLVVGHQAGVDLVQSEPVAAVAFTGSQSGGMALWRLANERERVIPVYAEMGTVNPVVVTPAALERLPEIAAGFVASFTLGAGQFCTKPGILLAPTGGGVPAAVGEALADAAPHPVMLTRSIAASVEVGLRELTDAGAVVVRAVPAAGQGWCAPAAVLSADVSTLGPGSRLLEECFGAVAVVVEYETADELRGALAALQGSLVAGVMTGAGDDPDAAWLVEALTAKVGRVAMNDWPTGVAFTWAQQHGGPWPATSVPSATSVGAAALDRFVRPVAYQSARDEWLPLEARSDNPWWLPRLVDGRPEAPTQGRAT